MSVTGSYDSTVDSGLIHWTPSMAYLGADFYITSGPNDSSVLSEYVQFTNRGASSIAHNRDGINLTFTIANETVVDDDNTTSS